MTRRTTRTTKRNAPNRSKVAQWLLDCRARGIRPRAIWSGVSYVVRHAEGITSHLWGFDGRMTSQNVN